MTTTMSQHRAILRDTALALVPLVIAGAFIGGPTVAAGTALAGVVTLVNVRLWMGLTSRLLSSMASEDGAGSGLAIVGFFVKPPLTLGVFGLLMWLVDPMAVALGLTSLVAAIGVRGFVALLHTPVEVTPMGAHGADAPQES
jgi:hypothetical protein